MKPFLALQENTDSLLRRFARHPWLVLAAVCVGLSACFDPTAPRYGAYSFLLILAAGWILGVLFLCKGTPWLKGTVAVGGGLLLLVAGGRAVSSSAPLTKLLLITLVLLGGVAIFLALLKRITVQRAILLLAAAGLLLRLFYTLYTGVQVRQHDVEVFGNGIGHSGYIEFLYDNFRLPVGEETYTWQFYHPPLSHAIAALWLRLQTLLGTPWELALERIQTLSLFYSGGCMLLSYRLFRELGLKGKGLLFAFVLIAFHPTFIVMGGSINNDMLVNTFMLGTLLWAVRWYKAPSCRTILPLAVCIGLGMSTKLSAALLAVPVAALFLAKLLSREGRSALGSYFKQFLAFGALCFPLGLFWTVRNFLTGGISPGAVPNLGEDSYQYVGFHSLWERFTDFSFYQFEQLYSAFGEYFGAEYLEFNPWIGLFKTAVFGEYTFRGINETVDFAAPILFTVNLLLMLAGAAAILWYCIRAKGIRNKIIALFLGCSALLTLFSYLQFCISYPHTCTMNIRYAVMLIPIGTAALGVFSEPLGKKRTVGKLVYGLLMAAGAVFALSSTLLFAYLPA